MRGTLAGSRTESDYLVARFSKGKDSRRLYALSAMLLVGSAIVFVLVYLLTSFFSNPPGLDPASFATTADYAGAVGNWRFDVAYYTAILSFLWIHYYHDHFLFTDFEALDDVAYR